MKKFLSFFCSFMIIISGGHGFCQASGVKTTVVSEYMTSDVTDNTEDVTSNKKFKKKHSKDTKNTTEASDKRYYGLKNIIRHPFKIIFNGAAWGFLGYLTSFVITFISEPILATIGFACGTIAEILELYEDGYNNAKKS